MTVATTKDFTDFTHFKSNVLPKIFSKNLVIKASLGNEIIPIRRTEDRSGWVVSTDSGTKKHVGPRIVDDWDTPYVQPGLSWYNTLEKDDYTILIFDETNASSAEEFLPAGNLSELSSSVEDEAIIVDSAVLSNRVKEIFRDGESEIFEAGMESLFSRRLSLMINQFGLLTLKTIKDLLADKQTNTELLAEVMRTIGRNTDTFTKNRRFRILIEGLSHTSPIIRDSASLGLCDMENAQAIPYLRDAIKREAYESLKTDFEQIIEDLGVC